MATRRTPTSGSSAISSLIFEAARSVSETSVVGRSAISIGLIVAGHFPVIACPPKRQCGKLGRRATLMVSADEGHRVARLFVSLGPDFVTARTGMVKRFPASLVPL